MTIEERLEQIELSTSSGGKGASKGASSSLQTDSFAVLLVQGLESKDEKILNVSPRSVTNLAPSYSQSLYMDLQINNYIISSQKIFQTKKEVLIKNTVARLPPLAVLPLVEEVSESSVLTSHTGPYSFICCFCFFVFINNTYTCLLQLSRRLQGHPFA